MSTFGSGEMRCREMASSVGSGIEAHCHALLQTNNMKSVCELDQQARSGRSAQSAVAARQEWKWTVSGCE